MMNAMVEWAGQPSTAWLVLAGAAVYIVVQATRASKTVLWGDLMEDEE